MFDNLDHQLSDESLSPDERHAWQSLKFDVESALRLSQVMDEARAAGREAEAELIELTLQRMRPRLAERFRELEAR